MARSRPGSRPCQTHFAKNENPWNSFRNGQNPNKEQCSVRNDQNPNREQAPVTLASRVATVTGACSLFRFWPFLRRQKGVCSDLYASDVRYFALLSGSFRALFALLPSSCRVLSLSFRAIFVQFSCSFRVLFKMVKMVKIQIGNRPRSRSRPGSRPWPGPVPCLDFDNFWDVMKWSKSELVCPSPSQRTYAGRKLLSSLDASTWLPWNLYRGMEFWDCWFAACTRPWVPE